MNNLLSFNYTENQQIRTTLIDGVPYFVAKDVCDVLELTNPTEALKPLDDDEKMTLRNSEGHSGTRGGAQFINLITESGLYSLVFRSNKPEAKNFSRWVRKEVLPSIRQSGTYSVHSTINHDELELRRKDLDLRGAQILQNMIDKEMFPITPETRTVFAHEVFKLVTGHAYLAMLPESTEKWYTASDIGAQLGISANMVGRIAKANGIKAPEGESNEFGRWIFSKSKYSSREVASFIYSEAGLDWFVQYQLNKFKEA